MGIAEADLRQLLAHEALRRLVTAYSRAVDRRDYDLLRSLYAPEAFDDHGAMYRGGVEGYVAFLKTALTRYAATTHYVTNMAFEIVGDRAEGEVHKINYHRELGESPLEVVTGSRSLDHYIRRDGEWMFLRRSITLDWVRRQPLDPAARGDFAVASPPGQAGPDDPSYAVLRLFGRHRLPESAGLLHSDDDPPPGL